MEISDKLKEVIVNFLEGNLSQSQADELVSWLGSDKRNPEFLRQVEKIWYASKKLENKEPDIREGLKKIREKISERNIRRLPPKKIHFSIPSLIAIAATVLVLVTLSVSVLLNTSGKNKPVVSASAIVETTVPKGSRSFITLPDGTVIWLNSDTKLSYHTDYNAANRTVYLTGEAYFKVSKNDSLPFQVMTSDIKVTAVGTSFNVKAYDVDSIIETTLEEGQVEISVINFGKKAASTEPVLLKPNQRAEYFKQTEGITMKVKGNMDENKNRNQPDKIEIGSKTDILSVRVSEVSDIRLYTSWKDKRWVFKNEKFSSLAPKLERRFNVKIVIVDKALEEYTFTGILLDESLEQVLAAIRMTSPIRYEVNAQEVRLYEDKLIEKQYSKLIQK